MTPQDMPSSPCPIVETIKILANRWNMITIRYLLDGPRKFNQLKRDMGNVSSKTLSRSLKYLVLEGLVERHILDTSPVSVEYCLTDKGKELNEALEAMSRWGEKWLFGYVPRKQGKFPLVRARASA